MSALDVRNWFREKIRSHLPEGCEYVETSNNVPDLSTVQAPWVTLEFQPGFKERMSLGVPAMWKETGRCFVKINTAAGVGEEEGMGIAEDVNLAMMVQLVTSLSEFRTLRIVSVQPPDTWPGGIDGRFFVTTLPVDFELNSFE